MYMHHDYVVNVYIYNIIIRNAIIHVHRLSMWNNLDFSKIVDSNTIEYRTNSVVIEAGI